MPLLWMLLVGSAQAFQPSTNVYGAEVHWREMPVYWTYQDAGRPEALDREATLDALRVSFNAWNAVPDARVRFIEADGTEDPEDVNLIYWEPDWEWDADILALTSTWSTERGNLMRFRIAINGKDPAWRTDGDKDGMDVQNALTHEVGHALGLAHDDDTREATMAPTAVLGETRKRDLHRSDESGARYLYPSPSANVGMACNSAGGTAPASAAALALLLALGSRRRTTRHTPHRRAA